MAEVDRFKLQNDEFDACAELAKEYKRVTWTAVVDDDYPEVRHDYERAVYRFLKACAANGRTLS